MNEKMKQTLEDLASRPKRRALYKLRVLEHKVSGQFYTHNTKIDLSGPWVDSWKIILKGIYRFDQRAESEATGLLYVLVVDLSKAEIESVVQKKNHQMVTVKSFSPQLARALTREDFCEYAQIRSPLHKWGEIERFLSK